MEVKREVMKFIKESIGTVIGALIIALGTSLFLLPNQLSSGGFSGIATIIYYLFNLPMGTVILVLNIPLFIISVFKVGKRFCGKALIGVFSLSVFIDIFSKFEPVTQDRLLASIYGGILIGIGTAVLFKMESSTGGSDLITSLAKAYNPNFKSGSLMTCIDAVVVILNVIFLKEVEIGLYSAIAIYLSGKMIDIVFEGVNFTKLFVIISNKSEEISKAIAEKVDRGTTGLMGKGMYKNEEKLVLLCAAERGDISKIKNIVRDVDPHSFVVVANAREVLGLGFDRKKPRNSK